MIAYLTKQLPNLQRFSYITFVFLWFKDNFVLFREINIPYVFSLILLLLFSILRLFVQHFRQRNGYKFNFDKNFYIIIGLIIIATAIRIPFFTYYIGTFNSDDALASLAAKHISEGKLPPIYHYGQDYLGTIAYHFYAFLFKILGYSILTLTLAHYLFFLGFIIIQFILFKKISGSSMFSFIATLFYCLPIGELLGASFSVGGNISVYLFLGSLCIYLSLLIYKENRENLLPVVGFFLGIAFWLHPITIIYAICSFIFIVLRNKFIWRKYLSLIVSFLFGFLPAILYEIGHQFPTLRFLFSGSEYQSDLNEKIKAALEPIISLISLEQNFLNFVYLSLLCVGALSVIYLSRKKREFVPESIFVIFFLLFPVIYVFSKFSDPLLAGNRYLYPLYFCIPFLLLSFLNLMKKKIKYILMLMLYLVIIVFSNIQETYSDYLSVKKSHFKVKQILNVMEKSGEKFWAGEFWQIILMTAISSENIIGWSYTHEDYWPYKLMYFNKDNNNYLFCKAITGSHDLKLKDFGEVFTGHFQRTLRKANNFVSVLKNYAIEAKAEKLDECWFIFDVATQIFPQTIQKARAKTIPDLSLMKTEESGEYLFLTFRKKESSNVSGFRLHIEIPGYCSLIRGLPPKKNEIKVAVPFPPQKSFVIQYYLDYLGMRIPTTLDDILYSPSSDEFGISNKKMIYLSGIGPFVNIEGKRMRVCTKEVRLKINKDSRKKSRVVFYFHSPFQFSHPYWYGNYSQQVQVNVNKRPLNFYTLKDGENIIEIDMNHSYFNDGTNFVTIISKYHLPFDFAPFWKTSILLNKVEFK